MIKKFGVRIIPLIIFRDIHQYLYLNCIIILINLLMTINF
jgi:hypothetical protein